MNYKKTVASKSASGENEERNGEVNGTAVALTVSPPLALHRSWKEPVQRLIITK